MSHPTTAAMAMSIVTSRRAVLSALLSCQTIELMTA